MIESVMYFGIGFLIAALLACYSFPSFTIAPSA